MLWVDPIMKFMLHHLTGSLRGQSQYFDIEKLNNPYSDTRILYGDPETEVRRIIVRRRLISAAEVSGLQDPPGTGTQVILSVDRRKGAHERFRSKPSNLAKGLRVATARWVQRIHDSCSYNYCRPAANHATA